MGFDLQPTLEGDLVRIRPLVKEDFDLLFQIASDSKIWEQHPDKKRCTLSGFSEFFKDSLDSKGALIILTKESGDIIGSSRFKLRPNFKNAVEIGWSFLARKYWGGQYNGEVKRLMMEYAFQHVDRILFFVDRDNRRSQKAVEKLGSPSLKVDRKVESGNDDINYIIYNPKGVVK